MRLPAVARLLLGAFFALFCLAGCGGSRSLRTGGSALHRGDPGRWPSWATEKSSPLQNVTADAAAGDSLTADADWLIDSLAVSADSLNALPEIEANVPDISDSLAAITQARLPSMNELFDYPVVVNRRVLSYVDFFLGRARGLFERSLRRSGRYLPMARQIFQEEGVPQDLVFLAHVESAFNYNARSPARALGLWQFIRGTARLYGLRCDSYVDERLDPERETRAAARYLCDLYRSLGDWHLALAAYNTGAGNVERAIERAGTRDFWQLAETRRLMNETRNFVPAILAATILAKSPGAYGLTEETDPPLAYDVVELSTPTDLRVVARCAGATLGEVQRLNPALLVLQTPPHAGGYEVRVPLGLGERLAHNLSTIPPQERLVFERHQVKSGENLAVIAHRYGTTVRAIQDANRLGRSTMIRAGQTLLMPSRHTGESQLAQVAQGTQGSVHHRVRRGETLSVIAGRYGVSVRAIQEANRLASPNRLSIGQSLLIPVPKSEPEAPVAQAAPLQPGAAETPDVAAASNATQESQSTAKPMAKVSGSLRALNNSPSDLGRGPSTAHLVAQARAEIMSTPEVRPEPPVIESAPDGKPATSTVAAAADTKPVFHIVRRGDTLGRIAERYGTGVAELLSWNRMRSGRLIFPGQKIRISGPPEQRPSVPQVTKRRTPPTPTAAGERVQHVVRRGDSLWKIAQRYRVHVSDLLTWNGLRLASRIYPGQRLLIYR